ncbi:uncharacterized protein LOC128706762 [Anopheles marshallii]|uniref:uncharacterized protein LOC128706762 n=1 Tax=Anopheles marshallii TaxID=1521116 RepID=UPI00237A91C2|nr:uncharacterized protein LOC128706762 [Anopheles marshallii]
MERIIIAPNALLWQKLAVKVHRDITADELQTALRNGATFIHIQCGLNTFQETMVLIDRCNEIIKRNAEECRPWTVPTDIICELSGPYPRVQFFSSGISQVQLVENQRITLTSDIRYEHQCFDEVKYVTNFDHLHRSSVGNVLSIDTVKLTVERIVPGFVTCTVTQAGSIGRFSVITAGCEGITKDEQLGLDMSSTLEELERVVNKGCKFIIVPKVDTKSLQTFFESIQCKKEITRSIQMIVHIDFSPSFSADNDMDQRIDAFVTKTVDELKQRQSLGKAFLYDLDTEGMVPERVEEADVIITSVNDLIKVQTHLKHVNQIQLAMHQQPNRTLASDEKALVTCLRFSAIEANASAIILPLENDGLKLAIDISLTDPLCIVLLLKPSAEEVQRILLRKYLVPVIVPAVPNVSQQKLIRHAIAYGRRFGYLHGGNCIVSGCTVNSDTDVLGLEMRYVPLVAHRPEP